MDRRCAAGALIALAACIATTAAAPTASNQTALDLYEGGSEGCYYNFQHYGEGDRIMTNEPCLNCTCHNRMLMCYLRVCPFTKPIGQDCSVEKRADQCCPIVTCPDVPVDLLTSTSTSSPSEYGETGIGKLDRYGCSINGKYFPEGSKVPPSPNKPCEHCYCIRNMTTCVMQECTLHVDGCTPIYRKDVCCPVRYSCDHPEDEIPRLDDMTTTVRPTPGFLLTTTTLSPVTQMTQDCVHDDKIFSDGALIKTEKACEHCYCMKGDIVCVVQECGTPMENEGKNCTSMPPREGQCCPDTYICEGDELTTETKPDIATVTSFEDITTLSPPRRVSVEGSGYRSETDEPSTEVPIFEPDIEGSGEDQTQFKPTDTSEMLVPESETSPPFIATAEDDLADKYSPSTTEVSQSDKEITEMGTTEADKGENTVPSGDIDEDTSEASVHDKTSSEPETTTSKLEVATESPVVAKTTTIPEDETSVKDKTTSHEEIATTEPASIAESTIDDHELNTSPGSKTTSEGERAETTLPTRRKEEDEKTPIEITTLKHLEQPTTKASDLIAPDTVVTDITTSSFIEHETETSTSKIPEKDNDVIEPTTEVKLELTTKSSVIETDTQTTTAVPSEIATELSTLGKVDYAETTSVNPIENEIDEESFPTLAPGRIPGEGDCLLDGVTYSHESIVPSSSNCHTSCRCISSIVKCEPIICSPPPDYMDNCQPMYDSPESCCPTYICDHPKETVPPQSHSQMAGTESPIPTPTIECDGDQCEIAKDEDDVKPPVLCTSEGCTDDSSKKPGDTTDCGLQGCGEVQTKPQEPRPLQPAEDCAGDSCSSPPISKDQTCNNENGCEIPVIQTCQGDNCANQPDVTVTKDDSTLCDNPESCKDVQMPDKASDCAGGSCTSQSPPQTIPGGKQDCKDEDNCAQPTPAVAEECNEEDCKKQQVPDISKPSSIDCTGTECIQQQDNVPQITDAPEIYTESTPRVTGLPGEPSQTIPGGKQDCKDEDNCAQPIPAVGECNEEDCKRQQVPDISKPSSIDCTGTECIQQQDNVPQITDGPEFYTESAPRVTGLPEEPPQTIPGGKQDCKDEDNCAQPTPAVEECNEKDCRRQQVPDISKPSSIHCTGTECIQQQDNVPQITDAPEIYTESTPRVTGLPGEPSQTIPGGKQDCKDEDNCAQPIPAVGECNEEDCKRQQVPDISKPSSIDCTGTECIQQQDNVPQITDGPEFYTESAPRTTGLPEEPETKPQEPITDLPKTTAIKMDIEHSATTKATISDKEEELRTTPQYDESDTKTEKISEPFVPESPEIVASEGDQQEIVTESAIDKEATMVPLQDITKVKEIITDVTPTLSEAQTTEIPSLPGKDTKETSTEFPSSVETMSPEPIMSIDNTETPVTENVTKDNNALDIATTEPSLPTVHSTASAIYKETTESQEMLTTYSVSLDSDSHDESTKEPEYVQDTEPKVSDTTERYTSAPDQVTDKLDVEPTTTKSYESQTNVPGALETDEPMKEVLHSSTYVPETQTTSPEEEEDKKESEMTGPPLTSEESDMDKPDKTMDTTGDKTTPDKKAVTKSPADIDETTAEPGMAHDTSGTQSPELYITPGEESITKTPLDETETQTGSFKPVVTLPQETATEESDTEDKDIKTQAPVTVNVQTETPMTIIKDHGGDEISSMITPESGITTVRDELTTKEPESPESEQSTELTAKPSETPTKKPISEFEKMPSVSDVEHAAATTEKSEAGLETTISAVTENVLATKQPSVTEASIQEFSAPQEETSEIAPITSIPGEDIETKSPVPVTESSEQPISEGMEIISPVQEQSNEATELPELIIHEHPTEPSSITKESEQPAIEDTATLPDMPVKEHEIAPEKDTSDAPSPQDDVAVALETPTSESQKEVTKSEQEAITKVPELSPTDSRKEVTEGPYSQAITTTAPEIAVTDTQKEATEAPVIQNAAPGGTKISETEPQETVTEEEEAVTEAEVLVTQPQKHTTDAPVSYDMISNAPDMDTEPHKESTDKPEESEIEPHKETTGIEGITTTVPEISPTESHKEPTEIPQQEITVSDKNDVEELEPENVVTSVPKTSATESQEETTTAPKTQDEATNVPGAESKKDITETSVVQDLTTSIPAVPVTENVLLEDPVSPIVQDKATTVPEIYVPEPQKEGTKTPTHVDTATNVPDEYATESQKQETGGPAAQDAVTTVPDTSITETHKDTQSPESEAAATSAPALPETESKKETTEAPAQESSSTISQISETETKKAVTETPAIQVVTDASEISDDSKAPSTTVTESQEKVTDIPEVQDEATNAPEVQTESQKEVTEIQETSEKTVTEPHNVPTEPPESQNTVADLSEVLTTESRKEVTEMPDIPMTMASNAPEMLATISGKDVTEAPEQVTEEVTKTPELIQTEKPTVTEKDETYTETPSKITTKYDDHTQSEPQEFVTSTETLTIVSDISLPTESGLPVEQFTKVTESPVSESLDKITGFDIDKDKASTGMAADEKKPHEGHEIGTETPFIEPTKTESPISSESIEPETKAPESMDSETATTIAPESYVTEKHDHTQAPESEPQGSRRTEATSAPVEEESVVTKAPQTLEPQDKTTKISEESEQTSESKKEYPETTPYLVLLEEHTHKTVSADEDRTASPSDVPLKEYEPSTTPEITIDKVTEPAPSTESEKLPEDVTSDKDQSVPELTQTTISEKIPESSLVSEEITTISSSPESLGTEKPQYVESNEISTSAPMPDQEQTEKPSVPSIEAETEKEVVVTSQIPHETSAPEEEFMYATTKATTIKEERTTLSPLLDKFSKPDNEPKPAESEKPKPDIVEEVSKPSANEVQPTEETLQPEEESHFPPSGTSGYGQEPDYGEEDSFGPGTCRYGGKVYVSAQQIPRDDPCDFCFCFRSDIICLQQSCPPPIHGCHEEPIQGFCCPRYECPVSMATTLNVTTTTTTTTTTLPPHFLPHAYKGAAQRRGCQIKGHTYKVGEVVRASSGPCLHCTCGGDGQMKCDPKVCTPEPMLRQMIAAAVSAKRRR